MAEVIEQPKAEEFKPTDFMAQRNAADAARRAGKEPEPPKPGKPTEKPAEVKAADPIEDDDKDVEYHTPKLPRSVRRELNTLRERAAAAEARAKAFEEMGMKPKEAKEAAVKEAIEDPEPQRKDFPDDAQHQRALGRWDARQEALKVVGTKEEKEEAKRQEQTWLEGVKKMDAKAAEDVKLIPDWDEAAKAMEKLEEDDPSLRFVPAAQPTLFALLMQSDVRAFMYHHFAKKPDDLRKILAMPPMQQIPFFNRLEGRVENLYSTEKTKEPAQGSAVTDKKEPVKDRQDPANGATPGRTAAASVQKPLPRPSTEVAARGGSAPPEEPAVGSNAWMARRNQAQFGR